MAGAVKMQADTGSGTCPSGTYKPPGKATINATLRCEIVPVAATASTATNSRTPSPQIKGKAVTVSSQLLRSLRLLHNCQLTVLVFPPPPPGAIIARESECLRGRQCSESAKLTFFRERHSGISAA